MTNKSKKTTLNGLGSVASPELVALGGSVRSLVDAMLRIDDAPDELERARAQLDVIAERLATSARSSDALRLGRDDEPEDARPYFIDGVMLPPYHPLAADFEIQTEDAVTTGSVTFGVVFEGPPGCVHGAHVAGFFDQILGCHNLALGLPAMTASLSVQYRRPTPLFTRLLFEVRIREQKGRKVTVRGALRDGDGVVAEADGLFVLPNSGITRDLGQIVREPSRSTPRGRS